MAAGLVGADRFTAPMTPATFAAEPDRINRREVAVMQRTTVDDPAHIRSVWPQFESLVGLRGRKMYARIYPHLSTYVVCTPIKDDDRPDVLGLEVAVLPGGRFMRGRIVGAPPAIYDSVPDAMAALEALTTRDESRPLVEFYRRHDQIELWVPIAGSPPRRRRECPCRRATVTARTAA